MKTSARLPLGRPPESALQLAHFVDGLASVGVVGTGPAGHALARACSPTLPPQGPFAPPAFFVTGLVTTSVPSDSRCAALAFAVGLYEPRCPDAGCADGPLVFRSPPCPRAAPSTPPRPARVLLRTGARRTSPSPRHDRLGSRVVNLSRLQASLDVAARVLAPSEEALDTPLGPHDSPHVPGVCYSALRCLPRRDLHPLETNDGMRHSRGRIFTTHHPPMLLLRRWRRVPWFDGHRRLFRPKGDRRDRSAPRATGEPSRPAVHSLEAERLEDEHVERAAIVRIL